MPTFDILETLETIPIQKIKENPHETLKLIATFVQKELCNLSFARKALLIKISEYTPSSIDAFSYSAEHLDFFNLPDVELLSFFENFYFALLEYCLVKEGRNFIRLMEISLNSSFKFKTLLGFSDMLHEIQSYAMPPGGWILGSDITINLQEEMQRSPYYECVNIYSPPTILGLPIIHDDSLLPIRFQVIKPSALYLLGKKQYIGCFMDSEIQVKQIYIKKEIEQSEETILTEDQLLELETLTEPVKRWTSSIDSYISPFNPRSVVCGELLL